MTTVLIIDDHAAYRTQARALLVADGLDVIGEAVDGTSGLEAVRTLRPDLVLLDLGLPDIDGFEVARQLALTGPPPLVVLTSSREASEFGPRLQEMHAVGFISKDQLSGAALRSLMPSP